MTAGWAQVKTPRRVGVGPEGLTVETTRGTRQSPGTNSATPGVETGGMNQRKRLNVTDVNGKSVAKLDESFGHFDEMTALVSRRVEAKGDGTARRSPRQEGPARTRPWRSWSARSWRSRACMSPRSTYEGVRGTRLLKEKGKPGMAEVVRRFVAPNGVTKRVEYRIVGTGGPVGDAERRGRCRCTRSRLEGAKTIPVVSVPDEPEVSRLMFGEVKENDFTKTPAGGYGLAALGGLMALFLLGSQPVHVERLGPGPRLQDPEVVGEAVRQGRLGQGARRDRMKRSRSGTEG